MDQPSPLKIGLFDIMQVDPILGRDVATMYANRLDDLALAESLGFDAAFAAERHFLPTFAASSATAWIAAASQRTSRMRLGAMGYTLPIKTPVQLAEDIAILDLLSQGRLEVGFGVGHRVEELIALGVDPSQRITLFQERLALLKALLSGGQVSFERGDVQVRNVLVSPLSVQVPHPPLWFAGTEPVAAQWMGANGLGLALGFKPSASLVPAVASFLAGRNGRSPEMVATDPARPLGTIALMRSVIVGERDSDVRNAVIDDLLRLEAARVGDRGEGGRADRRQAASDQFDTMVATEVMIAGSPETVAESIRERRQQLGFDLFLANVYAMGASDERIRTTLALLAGPVRDCLAR
jgi:alkanesulfonate monooxygenase SsuD/methylene tetrahydromethanopterin reductase-like flavin-dependent oxidoreductase (luciferase family)